ncbi:MAG: hypothetical protein ACE5Z5_13455 [Candidatus Bathyarchaeia archaeon]
MADPMRGEKVHLGAWMEVVGTLRGVSTDGHFTYLKIGGKLLSFPRHSTEAEIISDELGDDRLIGRKIGVLRTDDPSRPLRIRVEGEPRRNHAWRPI